VTLLARLRPHLPALLGISLCCAVVSWLGLIDFGWNDYAYEADPAFKALLAGHVEKFLLLCPGYAGSMILRAPFAFIPKLWGGGDLAVYRAVSLPAVGALGALALWMAARMRAGGLSLLARVTAVALIVAGPVAERALESGHPEELLAAVFVLVATIAALRGRPALAGVALGLAVATKPWALVAVTVVLLASDRRWRRVALIAAATATIVLAPLIVAGASHVKATALGAAQTGTIFQPEQVWWFAGSHGRVVPGGDGLPKLGYRYAPAWTAHIIHPLVVLVGLLLPLLWLLRRRGRDPGDLLLVLAFVLQLRCMLDTWNIDYYAVPMLLSLTAWETLVRRRPPALALIVTLLVWYTFSRISGDVTPDGQSLYYLAWSVPLVLGLVARSFAPGLCARVLRRSKAAPVPAAA